MTKTNSPRPLDHVVLPTGDLTLARDRLAALGFSVSPQGTHPFGTINCCVYLSDGTFLEPLAVGDRVAADKAVREGNAFVARDRVFRDAHGEEGFSAVVFGTDDADADHTAFVAAGVSAGSRLDFSRPFVDASGKSDVASFRLAFAAQPSVAADAFFFTCERANVPAVDRSALQAHANGAGRVLAIELAAGNVAAAGKLLATVARSVAGDAGVTLANARLTIRNEPNAMDIRLEAIVFAVDDLAATKALLVEHAVTHDLDGQRLVVPAAPGQGATFIFEEQK
ncbi:VOC family protein [Aminobacter sp. BA135]|uniref:VOC family protein n=1 Tax=Aminobacter sp. BA135 TaxID=537596 RepID=UPI003D7B6FF4